ncbi:MAG: hypothetical protein ACRCUI_14075, partial [Polymorphobacter sp.]
MSSSLIAGAVLLTAAASAWAATDALERSYYTALLADNARDRFTSTALESSVARPADAALDSVVQWDRLRRDAYNPPLSEFTAFLKGHPGWPAEATIRRHAERSITAETAPADRLGYFNAFAPLSAVGKLRLAQAYADSGRSADATAMARDAWDSAGLDASQEAELLASFGTVITADDNRLRFERLMWANQAGAAARQLPRLPAQALPLANARLALRNG